MIQVISSTLGDWYITFWHTYFKHKECPEPLQLVALHFKR